MNLGIVNLNFATRINKARKFNSNAAEFVFWTCFVYKVFLFNFFFFFPQ